MVPSMFPLRAESPALLDNTPTGSSLASTPRLEPKPRARDVVPGFSEVLDVGNDAVVNAKTSLIPVSGDYSPIASTTVMLNALEAQTQQCAAETAKFILTIGRYMHELGALSCSNLKCFQTSSREIVDSVTQATEGMQTFISRVQTLNMEMQDIELLYRQVNEIKQTLDLLESLVAKLQSEKKLASSQGKS